MRSPFILTEDAVARVQIDRVAHRVESRDRHVVAELVRVIEHTPRVRERTSLDAFLTIRLQDARGRTLRILRLDRSGVRGSVDDITIRFANDSVRRTIVKAFPSVDM